MLENVEELLLFVLLCAWAGVYVRSLHSCIWRSILAYVGLFLRLCICGNRPAYAGSCLLMWDAWQRPYSAYFTSFSLVSLLYAILTHFFFCHFCIWPSPYPSLYLHSCIENIIFHQFCLNQESNIILSFLQSLSPYVGRGSTNKVVEWYNLLVLETRAYIQEASFEPIIGLLPKKSMSVTLVQCLIKRW